MVKQSDRWPTGPAVGHQERIASKGEAAQEMLRPPVTVTDGFPCVRVGPMEDGHV